MISEAENVIHSRSAPGASWAAVVARELGIPCVMNTGVGTQVIRTGDLCRVDGSAGTVKIVGDARP
jgi:pyruvate,water dikinase